MFFICAVFAMGCRGQRRDVVELGFRSTWGYIDPGVRCATLGYGVERLRRNACNGAPAQGPEVWIAQPNGLGHVDEKKIARANGGR